MRLPDRRSVQQWLGIIAVLALIGFVLYQVKLQDARVDALHAALGTEQEETERRGETPVAPDPDELLENPDAVGPQGPPGPPPTDEAVYEAVAAYFAEHPVQDGETPSAAEIAAAVAAYLTENPPEQGEPGPPPSAEQVAAAVEAYLIANPPAPGKDGAQGDPGRPPTAAEIAAEVRAYIEENPLPWCPPEYPAAVKEMLTTEGPIKELGCFEKEQEED